jgi:uncharacterized protein YqjF (DUF2071 family)
MVSNLPVGMGWRNLAFLNYPIAPEAVAERLPNQLAVDTYDGDAWLSIVPFTNVDVRPRGLPAALGFDLPELNLRTYVERPDTTGGESTEGAPGVYFFSLDADGDLGVAGARLFHHLPYFRADITLESDGEGGVHFRSDRTHPGARPATVDVTYRPTAEPTASATDEAAAVDSLAGDDGSVDASPGSLAAFLTERYRYYTETPAGDLRAADVHHPRWPLAPADVTVHENQLFEANGFPTPERDGPHYYSSGVDVTATGSYRPD